ncbi:MAG: DUF433 domain-containing protein [Armatimonadetes bacterium]|nr:DUF433 domain-containing protein [Armatimonadota bacterium]
MEKPVALPSRQSVGSRIRKTRDIHGGDACIRLTRIPVWVLVNWRRLGLDDAQILDAYPGLDQADLDAAWAYYTEATAEIDTAIAENQGD